jgi:hypothetical protein
MSRLISLVFDANNPLRLARFWAVALGWEIENETGNEIDLLPTDCTAFGVRFDLVPDKKLSQNRLHLDLTTNRAWGESHRYRPEPGRNACGAC